MATHRIQLRGISRIPSNRATSDGGCSESLNVQIEGGELVPVARPKVANVGVPSGFVGRILYIHKGDNYENYIGLKDGAIVWLNTPEETPVTIGSVSGTDVKFTSLGNTLIYNTPDDIQYYLFAEGKYKSLGNHIPFPEINIALTGVQTVNETFEREYSNSLYSTNPTSDTGFEINAKGSGTTDSGAYTDAYWKHTPFAQMEQSVWNYGERKSFFNSGELSSVWRNEELEEVSFVRNLLYAYEEDVRLRKKSFSLPVYMKYSLALYDGSEIDSEPVLLCPNVDINESQKWSMVSMMNFTGTGTGGSVQGRHLVLTFTYNTRTYKIYFSSANNTILNRLKNNWSDIVKGVYLYLSPDITAEDVESYTKFQYIEGGRTTPTTYSVRTTGRVKIYKDGIDKKQLKETAQFFRVAEYTLEEAVQSSKTIEYINNTDREVENRLEINSVQPKHNYIPKGVMEYNKRLLAYGMKTILYTGADYLPSKTLVSRTSTSEYMGHLYYLISDNLGRTYCVDSGEKNFSEDNLAYLSYPHIRCFHAIASINDKYYDFSMAQHDFLPMSYFISSQYSRFDDLIDAVEDGETVAGVSVLSSFDPESYLSIIEDASVLYQTKGSNFYVYDTSQELSFPITGLSVNTQALSAGQHGQYPIIAFTKGGLWAVSINSEGALESVAPLQRDVALDGKVWQMDNATVFLSPKSVMLVSGAQVSDIAKDMNGRHYSADSAITQVLTSCGYTGLTGIASDSLTFHNFIASSEMAYDYNGNRLLFFNSSKNYGYAYCIGNDTWHRFSLPDGCTFSGVLNSYPQAYVTFVSNTGHVKYMYVTEYDGSSDLDDDYVCESIADDVVAYCVGEQIRYPVLTTEQWRDFLRGDLNVDVLAWEDRERTEFLEAFRDNFDFYGTTVDNVTAPKMVVYDYSTILGAAEVQGDEVKGVIVTRPFDCNLTDVYKTINRILIRGDYEQGKVKYRLLGSNDGRNFTMLSSRRGPSWKFYRILILTDLKPWDRLSYVEVEYEERYNDRIR